MTTNPFAPTKTGTVFPATGHLRSRHPQHPIVTRGAENSGSCNPPGSTEINDFLLYISKPNSDVIAQKFEELLVRYPDVTNMSPGYTLAHYLLISKWWKLAIVAIRENRCNAADIQRGLEIASNLRNLTGTKIMKAILTQQGRIYQERIMEWEKRFNKLESQMDEMKKISMRDVAPWKVAKHHFLKRSFVDMCEEEAKKSFEDNNPKTAKRSRPDM